jgi:hypothetical protein
VSGLDGISRLRHDRKGLLDHGELARQFFVGKNTRPAGTLEDLLSHAILDRGRLAGLWEFDTVTETIAWWPFIKKNKGLEKSAACMEQFVREQLDDAVVQSRQSGQPRSSHRGPA